MYVSTEGDSTLVIPVVSKKGKHYVFDTTQTDVYTSTLKTFGEDEIIRNFYHPSFDIDVLTRS